MGAKFKKYICREMSTKGVGFIVIVGEEQRVVPRVYFNYFQQPVIVRIIQETPGDSMPKQIMIGVNPTQDKWESIDLRVLSNFINQNDNSLRFGGRRYVIGFKDNQGYSLREFKGLLEPLNLDDIRADSQSWSIFA